MGLFGRGWGFAYESKLVKSCAGVTITKGSGQEREYLADLCPASGTPAYPVSATPPAGYPAGYFDKLTYHEGDYWIFEEQGTRLKYRYDHLTPDGTDTYRLVSITDRNGNSQQLAYNNDGTIKTFTDAAGRVTNFTYENGRCTSMIVPDGRTATYSYDAGGNMTRNSDLLGTVITYTYDPENYLTSLSYGGQTTTFTYNTSGGWKHVATVKDACGNTKTYAAASGASTSVTDALGTVITYTNEEGRTTSKSNNATGQTISHTYANGLPVTGTDGNGGVTQMTYDADGNLTKIIDPLNNETSFTYGADSDVTRITGPDSGAWNFDYDPKGNLLKMTSPLGREVIYTYNSQGLLTSRRDGNGKTTSWTYDAFGNVHTMTDANNQTTTLGYDSFGFNKISRTDPLGRVTQFLYDGNGRLIKITHPDGTFRTYDHNAGSVTGITDENGQTTTIGRSPMLNITSLKDPLQNQTNISYDVNGRATDITDANAHTTRMTYDGAGRRTRFSQPSGSAVEMTYDPKDNLLTFKDARSQTTRFGYDAADRLTSVQDAAGNKVTFTRNALGRIATRTAPGGATITYQYDNDGRLVGYNSGAAVTYGYDAASNLTAVTDSTGATTYAYDPVNRVSKITYPDSLTLAYTYDAVGNIATMTYPEGLVASYTYDNRNRVVSLSWRSGDSISYTYDGGGNVTAETRSNGTGSTYTYDGNRRVTKIEHRKGMELFAGMDYVRDAVGNVTQEAVSLPLTQSLTNESISGAYNALNQLTVRNSQNHTYDGEGNLTAVSGSAPVSAAYDRGNRLISYGSGGVTTTYAYNGLGLRTQAVTGGSTPQTRNFHHDKAGRLMFETDGSGTLTAWYIYSGSKLQAMVTPGGSTHFYHFDKTGNTVALTDGGGNVAAAYAYEPFGKVVKKTGAVANPFTYVGAYGVMEEGSGLFFTRYRCYDANKGKFLQKDPIGLAGGINLYAYGSNNPVNRIDPLGFDDQETNRSGEGQESGVSVAGVTGQVEFRLPGADEDDWHSVKMDTVIPVGSTIRTSDSSKVILSFADMSTYVMPAENEIVVCGPPEKESKVKLISQNIWNNIKKMIKDGSMEQEMNQAVAGKKG